MMELALISLVIAVIAIAVSSFAFGFARGIKDTERRWSEAVERAADRRGKS